jgi:hypothetical protein
LTLARVDGKVWGMSKTKQDEFLALLEKYPLPWFYEDAYAGRGKYVCEGTDAAIHEIASFPLHDAAPAMAAAILEFLRAKPPADAEGTPPMMKAALVHYVEALRAALPEELR